MRRMVVGHTAAKRRLIRRPRTFLAYVLMALALAKMIHRTAQFVSTGWDVRLAEATQVRLDARSPAELVFFAFSDRVTDGLCASIETAAMSGVDLHVIGLDHSEFDFSEVKHAKSKKIHGYLRLLNSAKLRKKYDIARNETIVVLADASDVIYMPKTPQRALEEYHTMRERLVPKGKALILFAAEGNCWPHMAGDQELIVGGRDYCAKFHEKAKGSSHKYLNSGGVIGPVSALAEMYREIHSSMKTADDEDQMITALVYAKQIDDERFGAQSTENYVIALDHQARVFQTGWHTHLEIPGKYAERQANGAYFDTTTGVFVNTEHNSTPPIIHFNGGKTNFLPVVRDILRRHRTDDETYGAIQRRVRARDPALAANCTVIDDSSLRAPR